jgi:hypothetical protein
VLVEDKEAVLVADCEGTDEQEATEVGEAELVKDAVEVEEYEAVLVEEYEAVLVEE